MRFRFFLAILIAATHMLSTYAGVFNTLTNFSAELVCQPDSQLCPNGGHAFRNIHKDCAFTPCEFVKPAASNDPLTLADAEPERWARGGAPMWFRRAEFVVPRVHARDVVRGKQVAARVAASLRLKTQIALRWQANYTFVSAVDIVGVPTWLKSADAHSRNRTKGAAAHAAILERALIAEDNSSSSSDDKAAVLVATRAPYTHRTLFGWLARMSVQSSGAISTATATASVNAMLQYVQRANSLEKLVQTKAANRSDLAARIKPRVILPMSTLVVTRDSSERSNASSSSRTNSSDWFTRLSHVTQSRVFAFLEQELWTKELIELPKSANISLTGARDGVTTDLAFTKRANATSASLGVFFTPLEVLVGREDGSNGSRASGTSSTSGSSANTTMHDEMHSSAGDGGDEAGDPAAAQNDSRHVAGVEIWNFTMLQCDVHAQWLATHPLAPFLEVRAVSANSVAGNASNTVSTSSSSATTYSNSNTTNATDYTMNAMMARLNVVVVSCWLYAPVEPVEPQSAVPVAAVRFVHTRWM